MNAQAPEDYSIIALDKFIQATRDSGYKGTPSAISELVDNSIQAGATDIRIVFSSVEMDGDLSLEVAVSDNGSGMNPTELRTALRFGGSSRFNDREGMGRYGMGLPNSSLSQAQRVCVHTWQHGANSVFCSYLDLLEIASGKMTLVPEPKPSATPHAEHNISGTVVTWSRCDRLDNKRISTLTRKLSSALGRKFRHFLWSGVSIRVNDEPVVPFDPLYLHEEAVYCGGQLFADEMIYEVQASPLSEETGYVRVRFSELPVHEWGKLKNEEKRARGISKGAGISIIRGGREVDYGWLFFGDKRRENYDDWWRCELRFDPVLDEAFGITHTKQQVRPQPHLLDALTPDLEPIARTLNTRARKAHLHLKLSDKFTESEQQASTLDPLLTPLPPAPRARDKRVLEVLSPTKNAAPLSSASQSTESAGPSKEEQGVKRATEYKILPKPLNQTTFFEYARSNGEFVLILNPEHPFYKTIYKPLLESEDSRDSVFRNQLDLMLLAAARSEALIDNEEEIKTAEKLRRVWSDTFATYINK